MNPKIDPDEDCCVRRIGESNCYVCLAQEQVRNKCHHVIMSDVLVDVYCNHPDIDEFPRNPLPKNTSRRSNKSVPPSNK